MGANVREVSPIKGSLSLISSFVAMLPGLRSSFSPPALLVVVLLVLSTLSVDAFVAPRFKKLPGRTAKEGGKEYNVDEMYFFFGTTYCPDSAKDSPEYHPNNKLNLERLALFYTNTSTTPAKIEGRITWAMGRYSMSIEEDTKWSCGKCNSFIIKTDHYDERFRAEAKTYPILEQLHKEGNLGFEFFVATTRATGTLGDNEVNYQYDQYLEYKPIIDGPGTADRYKEGAIHYKSLKIQGFMPFDNYNDAKAVAHEYTIVDVENDCSLVDPAQYMPSQGFYRLMVDGNPRGKSRTRFWWRSQYYWPINGDYFT